MTVTLEEMKSYLRVDFDDDDAIITALITGAEKLCADILRADSPDVLAKVEVGKVAVMYAVAYFYEHREEADHNALTLTLRSLLFGSRKEAF